MLKFEIDAETFEGLDDSLKSLYSKHQNGYRLQVDGIDPADELKEALRKERENSATAKQKARELEEQQRTKEEEALKQQQEFKQLYEREQKAKQELAEKYETFSKTVQQKEIEAAAMNVAAELTRDTKRAELLREQVARYARYTEEGVKFEMGGVEVDKEKITSHITENYPFLIDGSGASGGGATGGTTGGAGKAWTDMSEDEHKALYHKDPDAYRRLRDQSKAA